MKTTNPQESPITFVYQDEEYTMTREELTAAWNYVERENQISDADVHLEALCFGWGSVGDDHDSKAGKEDEADFEEQYGISYGEAKKHLCAFVDRFNGSHNCELTEDDMWESAIEYILYQIGKKSQN